MPRLQPTFRVIPPGYTPTPCPMCGARTTHQAVGLGMDGRPYSQCLECGLLHRPGPNGAPVPPVPWKRA